MSGPLTCKMRVRAIFVQLILSPAGRRELEVSLPELFDHVAITSLHDGWFNRTYQQLNGGER
jgi:hypothetical protein